MFKENEDFEFLDDEYHGTTLIKILSGDFENVIFNYGTVSVVEQDPPTLKYEYMISETGNFDLEDLKNNEDFVKLMGDLLSHIIQNYFKDEDGEIRTDNFKKLNLQ